MHSSLVTMAVLKALRADLQHTLQANVAALRSVLSNLTGRLQAVEKKHERLRTTTHDPEDNIPRGTANHWDPVMANSRPQEHTPQEQPQD
ncbi:Hypothetical predicted protein [Pelobates cultripes]|uniref:Uncharacterized protein n=1 Tax=Pelobates cultripes TaxID=61616 RepID=A0AAD1W395_PELCU|nr:Hypothetical predicted protein [Pelobates cultripes]